MAAAAAVTLEELESADEFDVVATTPQPSPQPPLPTSALASLYAMEWLNGDALAKAVRPGDLVELQRTMPYRVGQFKF